MKSTRNVRNKRDELPPLPPNEALSMLQSAIGYCQRAGLHVLYANGGNSITLTIEGAQVATKDGVTRFIELPPTA
jgi:hypothetical protein